MRWRLENRYISISLQGLPQHPTYTVPMYIAVWFTYCSSALQLKLDREVSRVHMKHISILSSILDNFSFQKPEGLENYYKRLQLMMIYLSIIKKDKNIKNHIRGLYQNHIIIDGEYIFIDGNSEQAQIELCLSKLPPLFSEVSLDH